MSPGPSQSDVLHAQDLKDLNEKFAAAARNSGSAAVPSVSSSTLSLSVAGEEVTSPSVSSSILSLFVSPVCLSQFSLLRVCLIQSIAWL